MDRKDPAHAGGEPLGAAIAAQVVERKEGWRIAAPGAAQCVALPARNEIHCISLRDDPGSYNMATTTMVHVRVDEHVKAQAAETLAAMGLSISDAVRVFLTRIAAEKQLPFALKIPNAETRAAMEEARAISRARFATADELIRDLEKGSQQ